MLALRDYNQSGRDRDQGRLRERGSINFSIGRQYEVWLFLGWSFFSVMGFMVIWLARDVFAGYRVGCATGDDCYGRDERWANCRTTGDGIL